MFNNHALIIAVEDYSTYDRSTGRPKGTSDVPGALNDARAMFRQCLAMGFSPERIRVLTSPKLSPAELGPGATENNVGEATRAAIDADIERLVRELSGSKVAAGLLTFSGHGLEDQGVALCPSDTDDSFDNVVHVAEVIRRVGNGQAADNLTMLLDCCHAQVGLPAAATLRTRLRSAAITRSLTAQGLRERVIAASRSDEPAQWGTFAGVTHGAFTWAITAALGQWKTTEEQGVSRSNVSYGRLVAVTRELLASLSFRQVPVLSGPNGVADLAFLHPGLVGHRGETKPVPDGIRGLMEIDIGYYKIDYLKNGNWKLLAYAHSDGATTDWKIDPSGVKGLSAQYTMRLSVSTQAAYDGSPLTPQTPAWTGWGNLISSPGYPAGSGQTTFAGTYGTGTLAVAFKISASTLDWMKWYSPVNQLVSVPSNGIQLTSVTGNYPGNCYIGTDTF
ncbi:caspase family protein [Sorangium sp. So ce1097]|uniref:caspase family protein n=1 Tax=Sorangium sp. So ce1097 TaxID=3133330 RepID=UPI003F604C9D